LLLSQKSYAVDRREWTPPLPAEKGWLRHFLNILIRHRIQTAVHRSPVLVVKTGRHDVPWCRVPRHTVQYHSTWWPVMSGSCATGPDIVGHDGPSQRV